MMVYKVKSMSKKAFLLPIIVGWLLFPWSAKAQNGLVREFYTNITAGTLTALTNNASFPNSPGAVTLLDEFEAPQNVGDRYGQRIRGYVSPTQTGLYTFFMAADQQAVLYLSSDTAPANKLLIASVTNPTAFRQFDLDGDERECLGQQQHGELEQCGGGRRVLCRGQRDFR